MCSIIKARFGDPSVTVYRRPDPIPLRQPSIMAGASGLGPVKADTDDLNRLVARQVFAAIASGRFPAGSILPTEHQLSLELGVSRTALREAIKGLAAKGLVETRRKRGTMVLDQGHWNMLDAELIAWSRKSGSARVSAELWASLTATQPALAAQAAHRRAAGTIAANVDRFNAAQDTAERRAALSALMLAIAAISENRFLFSLTGSCLTSLLADDPQILDRAATHLDPARLRRLLDCITTGNEIGASTAWHAMLTGETVPA